MQFCTQPRRLPAVLSIGEVPEIISAAPGPGLKYRAALSISYRADLRASEVCNLKVSDIDNDCMLIHIDAGIGGKDRKVMLSPDLLVLLRDHWREAQPAGWLFPGQPKKYPISARQLGRAFNSAKQLVGISTQHATASFLGGLSTRAKVSPSPKSRAVARIEKPSAFEAFAAFCTKVSYAGQ